DSAAGHPGRGLGQRAFARCLGFGAGPAVRRGREDRDPGAQTDDFLRAAAAQDRLQPGGAPARSHGECRHRRPAAGQWLARSAGTAATGELSLLMRTCLKAAFPAAALYALTVSAATDASSLLDRYLSGLETLRISFTQTLADSRGREVDRATGTLIVVRPGKFRWELKPEGAEENAGQVMVADGRNVWFYDRDLEQVTVKPVDAALSAT